MVFALLSACAPITLDLAEPAHERAAPVPSSLIEYAAPLGYPDWTVDCKGGADFETISEAIAVAADRDWISVAPCTYRESLDLDGKSVWIASTGSSDDTVLDANGNRALELTFGEGDAAALVGFTIDGARDSNGGAVYVEQAALRLSDVVFTSSSGGYGLIAAISADLELQNVTIDESNDAGYYGAVYASRGALIADGLDVRADSRTNAVYSGHGSFFIDHSSLSVGRGGYALSVEHSVGRVHRSTFGSPTTIVSEDDHYTDFVIFENTILQGDVSVQYGSLVVRNSLVDGARLNLSQVYGTYIQASVLQGSDCPISYAWTTTYEETDSGIGDEIVPEVDISYNDFYEVRSENCDGTTTYSGSDGNISEDPRFNDEASGDYSTPASSPLVDAGLPDEAYQDPDGTLNDIGLYGGPRSVGGGW